MKRNIVVLSLMLSCMCSLISCSFMEGMAAGMGGYNPYGMGYSPYGGGVNALLDPNLAIMQTNQQIYQRNQFSQSMARKAIKQTDNQWEEEYQQAKKYRPNLTKNQWAAERAQAITTAKMKKNQSNGRYNGNSSSSKCYLCYGSGKCNTCYGSHKYINPLTGKYVTCPNCKKDGLCSHCHGSGLK